MRIRLRKLALLLIGTLIFGFIQPATATDIPASFTFTGAGLGHGVGMSQIGAKGMALDGHSATEILKYFYSGTTVEPVSDDVMLRVNLLHQAVSTKIKIESMLVDSATSTVSVGHLSAADLFSVEAPSSVPEVSIGIGDTLALTASASGVIAKITGATGTTNLSAQTFTLRWSGTRYLAGPETLINLGGGVASPRYRYGQIHIKSVKAILNGVALGYRLEITDDLRLHDEYLRGVAEVPSSWPEAALEAQAIAARTYVLTKAGHLRTECDCDLYGHSVDLTYAGWAKESEPRWGSLWLAAVAATSTDASNGLAVIYNGKPITTYFFTSSGGHTQDIGQVWGTELPWLKSVADPWSLDQTLNPKYATWSRSVSQAVMAKAFVLPDVVAVQFPNRTQGGGIASAIATSSTGKTATLKGEIFRSRTALPSTWLQRPVTRRSGEDETDLSIAIGKSLWSKSRSVVLAVVDSDSLAAMVAAPLSFTKKAPLLFTSGQKLDVRVAAEILRRKVTKIYLVGTNVDPALIASIKRDSKKASLISLTGTTRYAMASAVAAIVPGAPILVANSDIAALGSSIGALASAQRPVLFTTAAVLPWESARSILKKGLPVTVLGTPETILDSQLTGLKIIDQRQPTMDKVEFSLLDLFAAGSTGIQFVPSKFDRFLLGGSGLPTFSLDEAGHIGELAKSFVVAHPTYGAISVLGSSSLISADSFIEINALR